VPKQARWIERQRDKHNGVAAEKKPGISFFGDLL
jgi:hypothetical protein